MDSLESDHHPAKTVRDSAETVNQRIMDLMQSGEFDEATKLVDSALERWPHNVRLQLTKGEALAKAAGPAAAALYYTTLLDEGPAHPWALGRLRPILSEMRCAASDARAIGEAIVGARVDDAARQSLFDALLQSMAPEDQLETLRAFAPASGLFRLEWKLAVAETEQGNVEAAIDVLTKAREEGRSNEAATTLLSELLAACSRLPAAIDLLTHAVASDPDRPDPQRRLLSLLQRARDFKRAGELMESAAERWPTDWMLLFRLNRLPVEPARLKAIFNKFSPTGDIAAQKDERYRFQFALACLHVGEIERARNLLRDPFTRPVDQMVLPVIKALGARSNEFWRKGSRLNDDRTLDVQITRSQGARITVVVPTGIAFGYLPPALIDSLFAARGANVIYLRDFRKRVYMRGVVGLGRDEAETIIALKRLVADLGSKRLAVMGSSLGGFAALRYGYLLDAHAAISFSGPTELISVYEKTKPSIWNPSYFQKLLLQREGELPNDLRPLLGKGGATRFFQFYGAGAPEDERQARRLEGLPNVSVTAVPGVDDHILIDHLIADGSFDGILEILAT